MHIEERWGEGVINCLSRDLKNVEIYFRKNYLRIKNRLLYLQQNN